MKKLLPVGRVSKLFGSGGELYANLYDAMPDDINKEEPLYVRIDMLAVPLFLNMFERRGRKAAVVAFDDIDNQTRAAGLVGLELFVAKGEESREKDESGGGEIYLEDLVGFTAILGGGAEGVITDFVDSELNPLFEVGVGEREVLIPAADDFIVKINTRRKTVEFDLPEGLLEL